MGQVFAAEKPLKDILRENQRAIKKAIRELDREVVALQSQEKKIKAEIKKLAAKNQSVCDVVLFLSRIMCLI